MKSEKLDELEPDKEDQKGKTWLEDDKSSHQNLEIWSGEHLTKGQLVSYMLKVNVR